MDQKNVPLSGRVPYSHCLLLLKKWVFAFRCVLDSWSKTTSYGVANLTKLNDKASSTHSLWMEVFIRCNFDLISCMNNYKCPYSKKKHRTNTSWNETWISNCCHDDCDWMTGTNLLTKSPHGSSCDLNEQICFPSALQRWLVVTVQHTTAAGQQRDSLMWTDKTQLSLLRTIVLTRGKNVTNLTSQPNGHSMVGQILLYF